jgi:hypothetical protein
MTDLDNFKKALVLLKYMAKRCGPDSATVRDMRASFIHDGHDPRRHSLGT